MSERYSELFQTHLETRLREGGAPDAMVSVARIYSEDDRATDLRSYAFRAWLEDEEFKCARCRARFQVTEEAVSEYDEVLCRRCRKLCKGAA